MDIKDSDVKQRDEEAKYEGTKTTSFAAPKQGLCHLLDGMMEARGLADPTSQMKMVMYPKQARDAASSPSGTADQHESHTNRAMPGRRGPYISSKKVCLSGKS